MTPTSSPQVRWIVGVLFAVAFAVGGVALVVEIGVIPIPDVSVASRLAAAGGLLCAGSAVAIAATDRARRSDGRMRLWFRVLGWSVFALFAGQALANFVTRFQAGTYLPLVDAVPLVVAGVPILVALAALTWPRGIIAADSRAVIVDVIVGTLGLAIVWFLVVIPAMRPRETTAVAAVMTIASLLEFAAIVLALALAATARRRGPLPIVQLILIQFAMLTYVLSDVAADTIPLAEPFGPLAEPFGPLAEPFSPLADPLSSPLVDRGSSIAVSTLGFMLGSALVALVALRNAAEKESPGQLRLRDIWSSLVPLSPVPLAAGVLLVALTTGQIRSASAALALAVILGLVIGGVLWLRLAARRELRRATVVRAAATFTQATDQPWFQALIENGRDLVLVTDNANRIVYGSPSFCSLVGVSPEDLDGRDLATVIPDLTGSVVRSAQGLPGHPAQPVDAAVIDHSGSEHSVQFRVAPLQGLGAEGFVLTGQDVTDTRRLRTLLGESRRRDRTTGLLNDEGFAEAVSEALSLSDARSVVVVVMDVIDFRVLNDSHGRRSGAALLEVVAAELERAPGPILAAGRVSAAGFAVLLRDPAPDVVAAAFAEHMRSALVGIDIPGRTDLTLRLAMGYSTVFSDTAPARDLVEHADLAATSSLASPNHPLVRFEFEMRELALREWEQVSAIETALADRQFLPYYQPIVSLANGSVVAIEALARRQLPDGTVELPEQFIPVAERLGLVGRIDAVIRERTFADLRDLNRRWPQLVATLNVVPAGFDRDFGATLLEEVRDAGVKPANIMFEFTESTVASSPELAIEVMRQLQSNGHKVALDDFGTGFSSLSMLRDLRVDVLKIDQVFTADLATSPRALALMRAIIDIGRGLAVTTVAEGVRTVEQADLLRGMGCDRAQGFLIAEPLALPDLQSWLDTRSTGSTAVGDVGC
ncbi:MAG: EAL domain-containing protein [Candidatus Nanopelagicales bacterium]